MRVTEATARTYLDDEIIKDMARRMLFEVAGERPGADLMEAGLGPQWNGHGRWQAESHRVTAHGGSDVGRSGRIDV